jgi:hypothetical protein
MIAVLLQVLYFDMQGPRILQLVAKAVINFGVIIKEIGAEPNAAANPS